MWGVVKGACVKQRRISIALKFLLESGPFLSNHTQGTQTAVEHQTWNENIIQTSTI